MKKVLFATTAMMLTGGMALADVTISGSIASLATRLMGSVAQKLAGAFFECAKGKIEN